MPVSASAASSCELERKTFLNSKMCRENSGQRVRQPLGNRTDCRAWLEFEVTEDGQGSVIRQIATFDPVGLFGLAYWYALYPLHEWIFSGMLRAIATEALRLKEQHERH